MSARTAFSSAAVIAAVFLLGFNAWAERPAPPAGPDATVVRPDTVLIEEWDVPWPASRPRDPYVAPDGRIWFCGQRTGYVAVLDPETGEMERFDLGEGAGPHNLIVDDEGYVWYAGNRRAHIGKMDPLTGDIVKYPMPESRARDPHTLVFDSQGDIWFTVQGGNFVGKLDTESGDVRLVEVPTPRARPYGIWMDSNDRPWIALFGTHKLATVDPESFALTEFDLPTERHRVRRLAITSDDRVWYADYATGKVGVYDPESGDIQEWDVPGGEGARSYAVTRDNHDRIWFVETGPKPNRFVGFDPATSEFFSVTEVPSGGGTIRHMVFHEPTNAIWFGTDANTVGRALLPPAAGS